VPFLVSLELRESAVTDVADVVFPVAPVVEKGGSFVNWEGRIRPFQPSLPSNAAPDLRVLYTLADEIGVSRQIVSNHLACLRGCGLVVAVPEGRRARYELADPRIAHALDDLVGLVLAVDPACCPTGDGGSV